jgi:hypothetical protein
VESGNKVRSLLEERMAERLFRDRLDKWRSEVPITTFRENLEKAVYAPAPDAGQGPAPDVVMP